MCVRGSPGMEYAGSNVCIFSQIHKSPKPQWKASEGVGLWDVVSYTESLLSLRSDNDSTHLLCGWLWCRDSGMATACLGHCSRGKNGSHT